MLRPLVLVAVAILGINFSATPAFAGPLLPCLAATLSANGNVLVINDLAFNSSDEMSVRTIKTSTFRVVRRYVDPNKGLRLNGPETYWADPLWSVVLTDDQSTFSACGYTLVTDDGEYLVLIGDQIGPAALTIYRRRDHPGQPFRGPGPDHGIFVRQISWSELWPTEHFPHNMNDHTSKWFAGGRFTFSKDDRTLIYEASDGKKVEVDLLTGQTRHS